MFRSNPIIVYQLTIESLAVDDIKFTLESHPICCLIFIFYLQRKHEIM